MSKFFALHTVFPLISHTPSLRRRRYLIPVSNVCEAASISLFWAPNGFNELPEVSLEFPFNLICISTLPFLTGQSWNVLKSPGNTGEAPEQRFRLCSADEFNQSLV